MPGAITGGDLNVDACEPAHLGAVVTKLEQCGVKLDVGENSIRVRSGSGPLKATDISTEEYPGFPTDMQAQYMALATQTEGTSVVTENIFENRFMHVGELNRMGADITVQGRVATVPRARRSCSRPPSCARTCVPQPRWCWRLWSQMERRSSTVSTTSTAATSTSKTSCAVWGAQIRRMGDVFGKK